MADITVSYTIVDEHVADFNNASDNNCKGFTVKVLPFNEWQATTGGNKKAYGDYLVEQSMLSWYRTSLTYGEKVKFDDQRKANKKKDL